MADFNNGMLSDIYEFIANWVTTELFVLVAVLNDQTHHSKSQENDKKT